MHRSRSVPDLNKDGSAKQLDYFGSVFRVTPKITEQHAAASTPSVNVDIGKIWVTHRFNDWRLSESYRDFDRILTS